MWRWLFDQLFSWGIVIFVFWVFWMIIRSPLIIFDLITGRPISKEKRQNNNSNDFDSSDFIALVIKILKWLFKAIVFLAIAIWGGIDAARSTQRSKKSTQSKPRAKVKTQAKPTVNSTNYREMSYDDRPTVTTVNNGIPMTFKKMKKHLSVDDISWSKPGEVNYHYSPKQGLQVIMSCSQNRRHLAFERGMERDSQARSLLKPWIKPVDAGKPFDKTHLIPFGYHGLEDDPAIIVGWDSDQNRGQIAQFETQVSKLNAKQDLIYHVSVTPTKYGGKWLTTIHNRSGEVVKRFETQYGTKSKPQKIVWQDGDNWIATGK